MKKPKRKTSRRDWLIKVFTVAVVIIFVMALASVDDDSKKALGIMTIAGVYLYFFCYANGYLHEGFNRDDKKNTRSEEAHTGKIINIENKSKKRVTKKRRNVNVI